MKKQDKIIPFITESKDGLLRNISEMLDEYRKGNLQCCVFAYRRKEEESTRTYFIGADDPYMFMVLERLKHDMLGLFDEDAVISSHDLEED